MNRNETHYPARVTFDVFNGSSPQRAPTARPLTPIVARRVATLERESPRIADIGRTVNVDVDYLGIGPMFNDALMFAGDKTDWIVGPVDTNEIPVVPREQRNALERLEGVGVHFPMLYVAHEVEKGSFPNQPDAPPGAAAYVPRQDVAEIVGPVPSPAESVELGERLSVRTNQLIRAIGRVGAIAGAAAAAPLILAGRAASAIGTLDPIVLGVIPAVLAQSGEPAAWYVLARWDW